MQRNSIEYEEDFHAWTVEQSRLLRAGEFSAIDAVNIAEEIESWEAATGGLPVYRSSVLLHTFLRDR
jgi:hypothetical protein